MPLDNSGEVGAVVNITTEEFKAMRATAAYVGVKWHAVISRIVRLADSIEYSIDLEGDTGERLLTVYRRLILFGQEAWIRAGGGAFVFAARDQERVAESFAAVITMPDGEGGAHG